MIVSSCPRCGRQQLVADPSAGAPAPTCNACGTVLHLPDQTLLAAAAAAARPKRPAVRVQRHGPGPGWWALLLVLVCIAAGVPTAILLLHHDATPIATESTQPPAAVEHAPVAAAVKPDVESLPAPAAVKPDVVTEPAAPPPPVFIQPRQLMPATRPNGVMFGRPANPFPQPAAPVAGPTTDDQVGQALQRGVDFLIANTRDGEVVPAVAPPRRAEPAPASGPTRPDETTPQWHDGINALCVYALLQAGRSLPDRRLDVKGEFVRMVLDHLKRARMEASREGGPMQPVTYGRALRASALSVYARPEDRDVMQADVAWLVRASTLGAYTYDDRYAGAGVRGSPNAGFRPEQIPWDHSNSQYGVLGAWSCAEVGIEVPTAYWKSVEQHWLRWQLADGEWGYRDTSQTGSLAMTAAGIASLLVTSDWIGGGVAPRPSGVEQPHSKALAGALNWLEQGDHCLEVGGQKSFYAGYDRFSLERVGLASGYKDFGSHDWYRELATRLIREQAADGSWGSNYADPQDTLIETAYDVLFLARGRHPILLSKLRFDGPWCDHPRDAANLARYATRELERVFNWQVVSIDRDWTDWADSPLLYLASSTAPNLTDEQCNKLRQFAEAGGLLVTQADDGSPAFDKWVAELAAKLWPQYRLEVFPDDHEIYHLHSQVRAPHPRLRGVSNGSRLLLVHSPADVAVAWQQRAERTHAQAFQLGLNLFLYATGKTTPRNRLMSPVEQTPAVRVASVRVARLRYDGAWDPEPAAWNLFGQALQRETGIGVEAVAANVRDLTLAAAPVAHLTGVRAVSLSEEEVTALRRYVEAGGVLLIDACGGQAPFADSVRTAFLPKAFPSQSPVVLRPEDPLLHASAEGMADLDHPRLRPYAIAKLGDDQLPAAYAVQVIRFGKGTVVYSPLDLTTGLLGANTWGVLGYEPGFARAFVRNLLLSTRAHPAP